MGLVASLTLPASGTSAKAVDLAESMVVAIVLANSNAAVTTLPTRLTFAGALHTSAVATAQMHAFKTVKFRRNSTAVASPAFIALAKARMNTTSFVGALIKTNWLVALGSLPATETSTLSKFNALTIGTNVALQPRTIIAFVVVGALANSGLCALSVLRAIVGAHRSGAVLSLPAIKA